MHANLKISMCHLANPHSEQQMANIWGRVLWWANPVLASGAGWPFGQETFNVVPCGVHLLLSIAPPSHWVVFSLSGMNLCMVPSKIRGTVPLLHFSGQAESQEKKQNQSAVGVQQWTPCCSVALSNCPTVPASGFHFEPSFKSCPVKSFYFQLNGLPDLRVPQVTWLSAQKIAGWGGPGG